MSISNVETLMTVEEVMQHLRIGKTHLYKLIREGRLKATKLSPKKTLFRASAVQALIEASEQEVVPPAKLVRDL